tara:strand:- start:21 stop:539 length:519 start_codon:yes stop_codon:yes gene_type:complete
MTKSTTAASYPDDFNKPIESTLYEVVETQDQLKQAVFELLKKVQLVLKNQEKEKKYRDARDLQRVYSFRHSERNYLMIGYTTDMPRRRKEHEREGWEYLGDESGTLRGSERPLKTKLKRAQIKPIPQSKEIFPISNDLINLLIEEEWVGITKDLLQKDTQTSLSLDSDQSST